MIKKVFLIGVILICASFSWAKELSPSIQKARQHRAELVQKQDEMLELLLQVPFEQRQYIFPLLSAKQSVPKKICVKRRSIVNLPSDSANYTSIRYEKIICPDCCGSFHRAGKSFRSGCQSDPERG